MTSTSTSTTDEYQAIYILINLFSLYNNRMHKVDNIFILLMRTLRHTCYINVAAVTLLKGGRAGI